MRNRHINKVQAAASLALGIAQILLIVLSWLIAAAFPQIGMRSLLSSEGIRWFFGQLVNNLACPLLVWMILLSLAWGAVTRSGLSEKIIRLLSRDSHLSYRERFAFVMVGIEILLIAGIMILLTSVPHAVLLNVTGGLDSGAFPASIVPVIAFSMVVIGVTYGCLCGWLNTVTEVCNALASGIRDSAGWWLPLLLAVELFESARFVFF